MIKALVFDAYGTLFDVYSVLDTLRRGLSPSWGQTDDPLAHKAT